MKNQPIRIGLAPKWPISAYKASAPARRIQFEIVDLKRNDEHFAKIIGVDLYDFHQAFEGQICIPKFVANNLIQDKQDKILALMEVLPSRASARR